MRNILKSDLFDADSESEDDSNKKEVEENNSDSDSDIDDNMPLLTGKGEDGEEKTDDEDGEEKAADAENSSDSSDDEPMQLSAEMMRKLKKVLPTYLSSKLSGKLFN